MSRTAPRSTLFPYTTLFRSVLGERARRVPEEPHGSQEVVRDERLVDVQLEVPRRAPDPHRHVVAHDLRAHHGDRKSSRLNSSHSQISYAVVRSKKKTKDLNT